MLSGPGEGKRIFLEREYVALMFYESLVIYLYQIM